MSTVGVALQAAQNSVLEELKDPDMPHLLQVSVLNRHFPTDSARQFFTDNKLPNIVTGENFRPFFLQLRFKLILDLILLGG